MHYKDNFEDAVSRLAAIKSLLYNAGYVVSDRDLHLANRIQELLLAIHEGRPYYDQNGNLKEKTK